MTSSNLIAYQIALPPEQHLATLHANKTTVLVYHMSGSLQAAYRTLLVHMSVTYQCFLAFDILLWVRQIFLVPVQGLHAFLLGGHVHLQL